MSDENTYKDKYNYYKKFIYLSYYDAIQLLLKKYGKVKDDYFKEKSYNKFLNDEIKTISPGKYSRTSEGLYCHHILEDKYENISNKEYIKHYKYPFEYQKLDNLVYCDLFEHLMLHVLIIKETDGERGLAGLSTYIKPMAKDWYLYRIEPKRKWMQNCKEKSYLPKKISKKLFSDIDHFLKDIQKYNEFREKEKRIEEWEKEDIKRTIQINLQERLLLGINLPEFLNNKQLIHEEKRRYIARHWILGFEKDYNLPRKFIVAAHEHFVRSSIFDTKENNKFSSYRMNVTKEDLLDELAEVMKDKKNKLMNAKYYKYSRLDKYEVDTALNL